MIGRERRRCIRRLPLYTDAIKRKQLYLPRELDAQLAQRARADGVPEAAVVREALTAFLGVAPEPPDPLLALVGIGRSEGAG